MRKAERASLRKWHFKERDKVASHPIFALEHSRQRREQLSKSVSCAVNRLGVGQETQRLVNLGERGWLSGP